MNDLEQVIDSLQRCADANLDVTDAVYERFFERNSNAQALMDNSDQYMRGRMLDQVLVMIMSEPSDEDAGYLHWELENHLLAYGVEVAMYADFMWALKDSVESALGPDWQAADAASWSNRISAFLAQIETGCEALA
ncbi:MAG: globin [Pseudomonadales bacterium]